METTRILNLDIISITKDRLLENLRKGVLVTPNVDHLVKLQRDREFYGVYQKAEWVVCDSKILCLLSKLLKRPLPEAIPGSSFFTPFHPSKRWWRSMSARRRAKSALLAEQCTMISVTVLIGCFQVPLLRHR